MRYECKAPEDTYELNGGVDIAAAVRALEVSKYRTRIWDAGTIMHVEVYSVYKTKELRARAAKAAKTNRAQANVNDRNARLYLERLVHINFREHIDLKIGLDYFEEPTREQAKKNIAAFFAPIQGRGSPARRRGNQVHLCHSVGNQGGATYQTAAPSHHHHRLRDEHIRPAQTLAARPGAR